MPHNACLLLLHHGGSNPPCSRPISKKTRIPRQAHCKGSFHRPSHKKTAGSAPRARRHGARARRCQFSGCSSQRADQLVYSASQGPWCEGVCRMLPRGYSAPHRPRCTVHPGRAARHLPVLFPTAHEWPQGLRFAVLHGVLPPSRVALDRQERCARVRSAERGRTHGRDLSRLLPARTPRPREEDRDVRRRHPRRPHRRVPGFAS